MQQRRVFTYRRAEPVPGSAMELNRQADALTLMAHRSGFLVVEDFFDEASGLTTRERPGLAALLDDLATGNADGVLVTGIHIIGTSLRDVLNFAQHLQELQAKLFVDDRGEIDLEHFVRDGPDWALRSVARGI